MFSNICEEKQTEEKCDHVCAVLLLLDYIH